ncbi:hypothetical protein KJ819_02615 [Patescibacteria group bacterium]|nr:hypothetical protein [Patescibacteria group bacterium]MBU1500825.1 hypothetical protein [Patescibacteria group bacterium]MBU2080880.1 hypothetical protein [Patescibacteria group bacterium]MBU2123985.1 hypothetical protein [Patescibacteria group bacterium]MBU2194724.1 hypothetical protein [Patescibacteria group bacterium]
MEYRPLTEEEIGRSENDFLIDAFLLAKRHFDVLGVSRADAEDAERQSLLIRKEILKRMAASRREWEGAFDTG